MKENSYILLISKIRKKLCKTSIYCSYWIVYIHKNVHVLVCYMTISRVVSIFNSSRENK